MNITIVDIANELNVSYTTVSRALNGKKGVSDALRKKIIEVAAEMGYHPNAIARGLVNKSTMSIALIIPDITNPFFPAIARGVEDVARKHHYNVFLYNTNWEDQRERDCLAAIKRNRVDGIIINPASENNILQIKEVDIPTVFLSTKVTHPESMYVGADNVSGGFIATEHLIECGYKRIAFVGGTTSSYSNNMRLKGYKQALRKHKINIDHNIVKNGKFSTKSGQAITEEMLNSKNPPDAIFAANDIIALGVLQQLRSNNISTPDSFGVVGFDNIYLAGLPQIQLTTIDMPTYYMGKKAFEMLLERLNTPQICTMAEYIIKPKIIIRKTTNAIK